MLKIVEVNNVRLHVDDRGEGPAIITLHGGPGLGSRHGDVATYGTTLAEEGYRVVSYDQRGNGESDLVPPFSHAQFVEDAEALRKELGLGKIVLAGHSYGGFLTLEYALKYPDSLAGIILADTAASNEFHESSKQRALGSGLPNISDEMLDRLFGGEVTSNEEFRAMFGAILPLYTLESTPEQVEQSLNAIPFHYETHNWAFSQNQPTFNVVERLKTIQVPTLILVGRHDWITPVAASEQMAQEIPNSQLVIFEHSGHGPQNEEPEAFFTVVRKFLSEVFEGSNANVENR